MDRELFMRMHGNRTCLERGFAFGEAQAKDSLRDTPPTEPRQFMPVFGGDH